MASGDYVMTVASDDVVFESTAETLLDAHDETPGLDLYYGDLVATSPSLSPIRRIRYPQYYPDSSRLHSSLAFTNQIGDPFTMLRRDWALGIGGYSGDFQRCQDWDMWSRKKEGFTLKHVGAELGFWRWHDQNLSANRSDRKRLSYDGMIRKRVRDRRPGVFHLRNLAWEPLSAAANGRGIYIWGAGEYGESVLELLEASGIAVSGFVDSDEEKWGGRVGESEISRPSDIVGIETIAIVIASVYEHEIAAELESFGFREGVDYFRPRGVEYHRI